MQLCEYRKEHSQVDVIYTPYTITPSYDGLSLKNFLICLYVHWRAKLLGLCGKLITLVNFTTKSITINFIQFSVNFMIFESQKTSYCLFIDDVIWMTENLNHSDARKGDANILSLHRKFNI